MSVRVQRQLPFALLGTALVIVVPALAAALLPGGALVAVPACVAMSIGVSLGAAALWRRLPQSRDILFSDLMLWGWLRRLRTERRLEHVETFALPRGGPVQAIRDVRALERMTTMLEGRDAYTRRHSHRVTRHCEGIARELGLDADALARVRTAAALHDIGKFFTPREVLNKPGRLNDDEFDIVKKHPGDGADLVDGVVDAEVKAMIRHHHERLGGNGYPDRLAGDAIPLGARIIAVADTFDAMTSTRAYRTARPHAKALRVLREEAGVALDARVVGAFLAYYSGRRATRWSSLASSTPHAVASVRELVFAGGRALPALGASAAVLAAPAVSAGPTSAARSAAMVARAPARVASSAPRLTDHRQGVAPSRSRSASPRRVASGRADGKQLQAGVAPAPGRPGTTGHRPGHHPVGSGPASSGAPHPDAPSAGDDPTAPGPTSTTSPSGPASDPASTPSPSSTAAPDPSAAPTKAPPEVEVDPVTVPVGDADLQLPPITVDLPDLPVPLPPIHLPSP